MAVIRMPPKVEETLSKLPFEETTGRLLEKARARINESAPVKAAMKIHEKLPELPEIRVPGPFGTIGLPALKPPPPRLPEVDGRRRRGVKLAVLSDVASVVGVIPVVGDILSDIISDTATKELRDTLTPEEFERYLRHDRFGPSTVAIVRTFAERV